MAPTPLPEDVKKRADAIAKKKGCPAPLYKRGFTLSLFTCTYRDLQLDMSARHPARQTQPDSQTAGHHTPASGASKDIRGNLCEPVCWGVATRVVARCR
jgi:hypothetical protein